jgi:hypothetical protein
MVYTRASFPNLIVFLALADIKDFFRFSRIHPNLTGAFRFTVHGLFCLETSMVFGSSASATSWLPIRRAIKALTLVFANCRDLLEKQNYYIDMMLR